MFFKNSFFALVLGLATFLANAFPDKLVRMVVPYPAGGATDAAARILADKLTQAWGHSVYVENKPGAMGAIGTELVSKSPADGYTLMLQVSIILSTELIRPNVNYRTLRDFVPVTTVFSTPVAYMASNAAPAGGVKEILAAAKAEPGAINYGHHGEGTTTNYFGEMLARQAGTQMTGVPYNGDNPILADLLGGHLKTGFLSGLNAKKAAETGKARIIAVASAKRSPLLPNAPTFLEQGVEGFEREAWGKMFVPVGTPNAIIEQIARDVTAIVRTNDVQERFAVLGMLGVGGTPAETLKEVQSDYVYWLSQIKRFGVLTKQ